MNNKSVNEKKYSNLVGGHSFGWITGLKGTVEYKIHILKVIHST